MVRRILHFAGQIVWFCFWSVLAGAQLPNSLAGLNYEVIPDFFQLPPDEHFIEPAGVAVNSKGHIYIFHRGKHPLMEFDPSGKFLHSIADDLFVTAHMLRIDADDNIWTTDIGSHVVLKLSPEGRVLLALGRMRIPGDDVLHFNQPTDVAWDRDGNIYVTDGYGNSRVLKFDKHGRPLLGWGMKGAALDSSIRRTLLRSMATSYTWGTGRTLASRCSTGMVSSCSNGDLGILTAW
jgi:hypothetical protein